MASNKIRHHKYQKKPCKTLVAPPTPHAISRTDTAIVTLTSLFIAGSFAAVPAMYIWLYKKWRSIPQDDEDNGSGIINDDSNKSASKNNKKEENKKKRRFYGKMFIASVLIGIFHRNKKVGEFLQFRKWRMLKAWLNYMACEVICELPLSDAANDNFDTKKDQAIFAIIPHGIVPFALGFASWPQVIQNAFGEFRPVAATATHFLPFLRTLMDWNNCIDPSKASIQGALSKGERIAVAPGGIAEMFEGYPKPNRHPNDECVILNKRKGFVKLALKNNVPIIPVFCFGASKSFKRLQLPRMVEKLSKILRLSIVIVFGRYGLPIPFAQKLLWVIGEPIRPSTEGCSLDENSKEFQKLVDELHSKFCDELTGIFERHKHDYGWGHKNLRIV